jgi:predicted nucleotidyltransferase
MDINTYLTKLSNQLKIGAPEKNKIETSISNLKRKIWSHFQEKLLSVDLFGSFDRETMLSRSIDVESDVDIMAIFKSGDFQPQTYLNWLRDFSEKNYSRSEVLSDFPTIAIEMEHIRFEIVPSYSKEIFLSGNELKIPAPRSKEVKWITTSPTEFKNKVIKKNANNDQMILPTVRLMKYWNSINGRPFSSYSLENFIVEHSYSSCSNLRDFFYEVISDLNNASLDQQERQFVNKIYEKRRRLISLEKNNIPEYIEQELSSFLPFINN